MNQETIELFNMVKEFLNYHKMQDTAECLEAELQTKQVQFKLRLI